MPERPDLPDATAASGGGSTGSTGAGSEDGQERAVAAAAALTAVMAAGLVTYAVFLAVEWVREAPSEPLNAALIIGFSLLWALALGACARALLDRRRWARAPAFTSALLLLALGWMLVGGHGTEVTVGWVVLVVAGTALVALGRPSVGAALR